MPTILNEAVNFEKQAIFVAVPKTGTTSIRSQLKQSGTPLIDAPHLNIAQIRDALYIYFLKTTLGTNRSFPNQTFPSDADIRANATKTFKSFFKFSAVRNPWARAVSVYSRQDSVYLKPEVTFRTFCEHYMNASDTCLFPTLHKNQMDWFVDENGKILMDYVYKLENFDSAMDEIEQITNGRLKLKKIRKNVNSKSDSHAYRDYYDDETKKLIGKRFEKDIDSFKYTF